MVELKFAILVYWFEFWKLAANALFEGKVFGDFMDSLL